MTQSLLTARELFGIPASRVPELEDEIRGLLQQVPLGDLSADDVMRCLLQNDMQLWVTPEIRGILVTEIVKHPQRTVLLLRYASGKMPSNPKAALSQVVIPWAKSYGCTKIEVAGRPGWRRVLGLTERFTVMRGDI